MCLCFFSDRVAVGRALDLPVYFGDAGSREVGGIWLHFNIILLVKNTVLNWILTGTAQSWSWESLCCCDNFGYSWCKLQSCLGIEQIFPKCEDICSSTWCWSWCKFGESRCNSGKWMLQSILGHNELPGATYICHVYSQFFFANWEFCYFYHNKLQADNLPCENDIRRVHLINHSDTYGKYPELVFPNQFISLFI